MTRESQLEAEKMKLTMLNVLTNPSFEDAGKAREWGSRVKKVWSDYLSLQYGVELPEHTEKEIQMMEYYENVVKHLKPTLTRDKKGLGVKGLDVLFR